MVKNQYIWVKLLCSFFLLFFVLANPSHAELQQNQKTANKSFLEDSQPLNNSIKSELSAAEQEWIRNHPKIKVGGSPEWVPFDFVDNNGQYSGIANDYLNLIAKKTGITFEIKVDTWSEQLDKIRSKQIDVIGAAYYSESHNQFVTYSTPYFEVLDYFFVRNDLNVKTLQDLNGKRVAIPKEFAHGDFLAKNFPAIKILLVSGFDEAVDAVLENQADLLYDSYAVLISKLKKEGISTIVPFKSTRHLSYRPIHIISRNDQPLLASILQKGLEAISEQERNTIYDRWISTSLAKTKISLHLTQVEKAWLKEHPVISLGSDNNWPPYEVIDEAGNQQGLTADILRLVEQRLGIKFSLALQNSWSETLAKLNSREIDIVGSIIKTTKREQNLTFSQPYIKPSIVIYTRKDSKSIVDIADLNGKTVSVEANYYVTERLEHDYPKIKRLVVNDTVEALKALSYGKVDAYVGVQGPANAIIEQLALTNLNIVYESGLGEANLSFAVRNDWPVFLSILNKTLASIPEAEMAALRHKWLGISTDKKTLLLSPEEQQWLDNHKSIRFTGDPNWLPYEAFDKQGNYIGIVAEFIKLIEQRLGIDIEVIPTDSWAESIAKVKQGDIDVLSETINSTLNQELQFTQPYLSSPIVIVMNEQHGYVENINEIDQKAIAIIKDYGYVNDIQKHYPELNFYTVNNIKEGLTKVSTGEIDALLATLAQASYHISELGINNVRIVGKTEFNTQLAFGMKEDFSQLTTLFNRALKDITPVEKRRILDIWGNQQFAAKTDYSLAAKIAGALILLNALFFYWNRKLKIEVAKRKASERETRILNKRLALATETVSLGVWQWDLTTTDSFVFDDRMYEIYGIPKQDSIPFTDWINKVHPDDHKTIDNALDILKKSGGQQHVEFRITRPDGSLRYIYSAATIMTDEHNGNTKLYGVNWDITDRKQAEEQFKSIIEAMPLAVVIADHEGNILLENPHVIKEIGDNKSLIGRNTSEFYADSQERGRILEILKKEGAITRRQVKYRITDGQTIDCLLSILPVNYQKQDVWLAVVINLTDRIKIEKDLALAKEQAESASRAKSAFLANMSHEIRTPMNAIIGFTELLNEQVKEPRLKAYVKTIHSAGNSLLTLINDVLDLSKIEAGKITIEKTATNPHDIFTELGNIFMMNIRNKRLELILEIDPKIPDSLMLDATRLRQVLFNLVGNAVKFTEQGYVRLKASTSNEDNVHSQLDLVIDVEDTGIGIPQEQQEKIFAEFTQSDHQDHQKFGGTGLGLSISSRLTQLMDGKIFVKSQPGKGSTFTLCLNNVDVASVKAKSIDSMHEMVKQEIKFSPAVVLVVDDIANNRDLIKEIFAQTKIQAIEAKDGQEAIDIAQIKAVDLILMDLRMPVVDGYQAAEQIKSFQDVPIIALTASVMKDDHDKIKSEFFDGYLRKPVLKTDLFQELSLFLEHQKTKPVNEVTSRLMLTEMEQKVLPEVLEKLEEQTQLLASIHANNNISNMKKFSSKILNIAKTYQFIPLMQFSERLDESINAFDIVGIKQQMNEYSSLHNELKSWVTLAE